MLFALIEESLHRSLLNSIGNLPFMKEHVWLVLVLSILLSMVAVSVLYPSLVQSFMGISWPFSLSTWWIILLPQFIYKLLWAHANLHMSILSLSYFFLNFMESVVGHPFFHIMLVLKLVFIEILVSPLTQGLISSLALAIIAISYRILRESFGLCQLYPHFLSPLVIFHQPLNAGFEIFAFLPSSCSVE